VKELGVSFTDSELEEAIQQLDTDSSGIAYNYKG
jgi:hypothetical protein